VYTHLGAFESVGDNLLELISSLPISLVRQVKNYNSTYFVLRAKRDRHFNFGRDRDQDLVKTLGSVRDEITKILFF
jgi:hypothetical protein